MTYRKRNYSQLIQPTISNIRKKTYLEWELSKCRLKSMFTVLVERDSQYGQDNEQRSGICGLFRAKKTQQNKLRHQQARYYAGMHMWPERTSTLISLIVHVYYLRIHSVIISFQDRYSKDTPWYKTQVRTDVH